jgi:hypothetical protein
MAQGEDRIPWQVAHKWLRFNADSQAFLHAACRSQDDRDFSTSNDRCFLLVKPCVSGSSLVRQRVSEPYARILARSRKKRKAHSAQSFSIRHVQDQFRTTIFEAIPLCNALLGRRSGADEPAAIVTVPVVTACVVRPDRA